MACEKLHKTGLSLFCTAGLDTNLNKCDLCSEPCPARNNPNPGIAALTLDFRDFDAQTQWYGANGYVDEDEVQPVLYFS